MSQLPPSVVVRPAPHTHIRISRDSRVLLRCIAKLRKIAHSDRRYRLANRCCEADERKRGREETLRSVMTQARGDCIAHTIPPARAPACVRDAARGWSAFARVSSPCSRAAHAHVSVHPHTAGKIARALLPLSLTLQQH